MLNWTVIIIETIVMTAAFTAMILIPLVKNPVWWIHDYPEDIQEAYFKTHERVPSSFFSATVLAKKGCALLVALALLLLIVWLAGAYDFWSAFGVGYGIWLFIDWYDCLFLDWVLFANMKAVRLPGTEHKALSFRPIAVGRAHRTHPLSHWCRHLRVDNRMRYMRRGDRGNDSEKFGKESKKMEKVCS